MQIERTTEAMCQECVLIFDADKNISLSALSELFSLINGIVAYIDAYIKLDDGNIVLRSESSRLVWEFASIGAVNKDGTIEIDKKAVLEHIQNSLIKAFLELQQTERRFLYIRDFVNDFFRWRSFTLSDTPSALHVESISYNSPLVLKVKSATYLLIVLTFIGGGKFEVGLDGITVEMPGVEGTIRAIRESVFPIKNNQFRQQIVESEAQELSNDLKQFMDLNKLKDP